MTAPRPVRPGTRYLITRRTTQRQYLLRPDDGTNQIVRFAAAYAATITGVVIHAFVSMSNHAHPVVTDPLGKLPQFLHALDRTIACCMNSMLGRSENFWSSDPPSAIPLESDEDVIDKIAYVIANPVAAGLVEQPAQWPGVITPVEGMRVTIERPKWFFGARSKVPASIELNVVPPELASYDGPDSVVARLRTAVDEKVRAAHVAMAEAGLQFLGPARVLATSRSATASTPEPLRARRPEVSAQDKARRCSARDRLRAFRGQYRLALHAWRRGDREAVFPAGTYQMRLLHGVPVEPFPD